MVQSIYEVYFASQAFLNFICLQTAESIYRVPTICNLVAGTIQLKLQWSLYLSVDFESCKFLLYPLPSDCIIVRWLADQSVCISEAISALSSTSALYQQGRFTFLWFKPWISYSWMKYSINKKIFHQNCKNLLFINTKEKGI